ncbi:TolC family protein [Undibacterium sp. FT147W]|uniref:TolC family protein n=1 Tax=Undibacterium rivi TaxID=2828729 RepID=A0ABS5H2G6_9BURK|nr:TolC family protein [Undibacterium rivi]MBR7792895.1 TolC family protein [Undibacterium rivi]
MSPPLPNSFGVVLPFVSAMLLAGCTSFEAEKSVDQINQQFSAFTQSSLKPAFNAEQKSRLQATADRLLQEPVSQNDAVQIALTNSPGFQAMLAQYWANGANAAQQGRIANPFFSIERSRFVDELEIARTISVGLLDVLTLPRRNAIAQSKIEAEQWQFSNELIDRITQVRAAWVKAVAAQQILSYAMQVSDAAEAGAELAQRMRSAGNFNQLQAARQRAFYADAVAQLAAARHSNTAAREGLVRLLGLTSDQLARLRLPEHLPDLPDAVYPAEKIAGVATEHRLDVRMAQALLDTAAKQQGLTLAASLTDIELSVKRNTIFDNTSKTSDVKRGVEIGVRLPVFDSGQLQRDAMNAATLAASYRLENTLRNAASELRESYSAYRTSYDIAHHYQHEILPLRKRISQENQLRYNGMFISVFDLLADSREQISSVIAAINAEQQFWLADAALQASMIGRPERMSVTGAGSASEPATAH